MARFVQHNNRHRTNHKEHNNGANNKQLVRLVGLFRKSFAGRVETRLAATFGKLVQTHSARQCRGLIAGFSRGHGAGQRGHWRWRLSWRRGWSLRGGWSRHWHSLRPQLQLDLSQPQRLPGLQYAFRNFLSVDKGPVRGIQILDDDIAAAQHHLAMVAGDRRFSDLERIVIDTANRSFVHIQVVGTPVQSSAEDDKFRHILLTQNDYVREQEQVKRKHLQ